MLNNEQWTLDSDVNRQAWTIHTVSVEHGRCVILMHLIIPVAFFPLIIFVVFSFVFRYSVHCMWRPAQCRTSSQCIDSPSVYGDWAHHLGIWINSKTCRRSLKCTSMSTARTRSTFFRVNSKPYNSAHTLSCGDRSACCCAAVFVSMCVCVCSCVCCIGICGDHHRCTRLYRRNNLKCSHKIVQCWKPNQATKYSYVLLTLTLTFLWVESPCVRCSLLASVSSQTGDKRDSHLRTLALEMCGFAVWILTFACDIQNWHWLWRFSYLIHSMLHLVVARKQFHYRFNSVWYWNPISPSINQN